HLYVCMQPYTHTHKNTHTHTNMHNMCVHIRRITHTQHTEIIPCAHTATHYIPKRNSLQVSHTHIHTHTHTHTCTHTLSHYTSLQRLTLSLSLSLSLSL